MNKSIESLRKLLTVLEGQFSKVVDDQYLSLNLTLTKLAKLTSMEFLLSAVNKIFDDLRDLLTMLTAALTTANE
jgi:hypothetical protein